MSTPSAAQAAGESVEQKIARLERELAAAQADAERYRWLRAHDVLCWSREPNGTGKAPIETSHSKKLDAAIDAAIAAKLLKEPTK